MSIKNPLTPARIEPAIFRFVAQHLNHCATAVPKMKVKAECILILSCEVPQLRCIDYNFISVLVLLQDMFIAAILTCVTFVYNVLFKWRASSYDFRII